MQNYTGDAAPSYLPSGLSYGGQPPAYGWPGGQVYPSLFPGLLPPAMIPGGNPAVLSQQQLPGGGLPPSANITHSNAAALNSLQNAYNPLAQHSQDGIMYPNQASAVVNADSLKHYNGTPHMVEQGQYQGLYPSAGFNPAVQSSLLQQVQQQQLQAGLQSSNAGAAIQGVQSMPGSLGVSLPAVTAPPAVNLPPGFAYPADLWRQAMFSGGLLPAGVPPPDLNSLTAASATAAMHPAPLPMAKSVDETEMKKLRRKQSNRESARRSRLRKQAETQEMSKQVDGLSNMNTELRRQLMSLNEMAEKLNAQNTTLQEYLLVLKCKAGIPDATGRVPNGSGFKLEPAHIKDILTSDPAKEYQALVAKFQETVMKPVLATTHTAGTTDDDDDQSDDDDDGSDGSDDDDSLGQEYKVQPNGAGSTGLHVVPAGVQYAGDQGQGAKHSMCSGEKRSFSSAASLPAASAAVSCEGAELGIQRLAPCDQVDDTPRKKHGSACASNRLSR